MPAEAEEKMGEWAVGVTGHDATRRRAEALVTSRLTGSDPELL
jgi:hypothetical protein